MERALELSLLRKLLDLYAAHGTSVADAPRRQKARVYTDRARHAAETNKLFRDSALIAGLSCDLPEPGSYFAVELGTIPVIVVRGADGQVRAFLNACRHRGSTVATGRGTGAIGFSCRYHAWSYDLGGKLVARPLARDAFNTSDECSNLIELPCAEACGVIVVGTSRDTAIDARAMLGTLGDELANYHLEGYRLVGERAQRWPFNWKLGFETFLESYHIFSLHRDSLGRQLKSVPMLSEFMAPHGRGIILGNEGVKLCDKPEAEWSRFHTATLVYWLFPNTVLSMPQSGHGELWTLSPVDDHPDHAFISVRFYAAPGAPRDDAFWNRLIEFTTNVVYTEDFAQQTLIQRNVATGLLDEVVFGRNEPAMIHFHEQLDARLGEVSGE